MQDAPAAAFTGMLPTARLSRRALLGAAGLSLGVWLLAERYSGRLLHPRFTQMLAAAQTMQVAIDAVRAEKERRGLMQPAAIDVNRTGLIGPEWSEITTTIGILPAKRTAANPDLAAALVRAIGDLSLPQPARVAIVASASLVGANVAILTALAALGHRPWVLSSLGASMYGATDLDFTWLDIEATLRDAGLPFASSRAAVLGAEGAVGRGLSPEGVAALRRAAERHGVPVIDGARLDDLVTSALAAIEAGLGGAPHLAINVGGSLIGLGACSEADRYETGLITTPQPCDGTAGLIGRWSAGGVPVLHLLNMRRLAIDFGLPYDPVPLPRPGEAQRVYGGSGLFWGA